ncbi:hypothetical protein B5V02_19475 [Mesorhizobium kowhaii]|uniref:Uncharacterized protein n=1 Tax=Mesorhizobium kowhaii TaxID=1300272 RepID=A0A2W7C207_9HYPH|nr:hypothetical protein B5V02_19475 [Mesorhizobium kowhaii]
MRYEDLPKRGDMIYMNMPMQPLPGMGTPVSPTAALEMKIDLLKAKIAHKSNPVDLEYERRCRESAHYKRSLGHRG